MVSSLHKAYFSRPDHLKFTKHITPDNQSPKTEQNHPFSPFIVLDRKLQPIPRKIPSKEPLRILRPLGPRADTRRVRSSGGIIPAALEVGVDALLQRKQGLWRADAEARVARGVARDAVVVVLG